MKCKVPRTQALSLGITCPRCPLAACDVLDVISASVAAALAASGSKSAAQTTHTRFRSLEAPWSNGGQTLVNQNSNSGLMARVRLGVSTSIYAPTDAEGKPITFAVLGSRTHVSMALSVRRAGPTLLVSPSESSWVSGFGSV